MYVYIYIHIYTHSQIDVDIGIGIDVDIDMTQYADDGLQRPCRDVRLQSPAEFGVPICCVAEARAALNL